MTNDTYIELVYPRDLDCGQPRPPTNGSVTTPEGSSEGSVAVFTCDNGFKLVGTGTVACLSTGRWSQSSPICQPGTIEIADIFLNTNF